MKRINIALISVITLTFLTGCFFPSNGIEGTSVGLTESSSSSETGNGNTEVKPTSGTTIDIPTTTNDTSQQTSSGNSQVSNTETSNSDTTNSSITSSETSETTFSIETSSTTSTTSSETCGNFILDPGEECDEGPLDTRTCFDCGKVFCGDFIVTPNEECDDGLEGSGKCTVECTNSFCGDGIINPQAKEECDEANNVDYDGCSTECYRPKWVFLTKNTYNANFGGIGEASNFCKKEAQMAGLPGNYEAWTSDMFQNNAPNPRWLNLEFKGWYRMPSDPPTLFAKGYNGLQDPENGLNIHADGKQNLTLTKAWTATLPNGKKNEAYGNCTNWTKMEFNDSGGVGNPQATDSKWTNDSGPLCGSLIAGIYCFEK